MKAALRPAVLSLSVVLMVCGHAISDDAKPLLTLKENLVIDGGADETKGSGFSQVGEIQADDQGRIYVLDRKECLVRVFDAQGRPVRSFGKTGQGPGDLQFPTRMKLVGRGLWIVDHTNKKIVEFDLGGNLAREIDLRWISGMFGCEAVTEFAIYGNLVLFQNDGSVILRLDRFSLTDRSSETVAETRMVSVAPKFNPLEPFYLLRALPDGRLVWIYSGEYTLNLLSADAKLEIRKTRDDPPVKVTEEDKERKIVEMYGGKNKIPGDTVLIWPKHFPPIAKLEVTDEGWIIVGVFVKVGQDRRRYDVFEGLKGEYLGSFHHPAKEALHAWKSGMAYFSAEDDQGYPTVKRYEVRLTK